MDTKHFDDLTKILARPQPRRRFLGALAVGLIGGLSGTRLTAARPRVSSACDDYCRDTGDLRDQCLAECQRCGSATTDLCKGPNGLITCCPPGRGLSCNANGTCCAPEAPVDTCRGACDQRKNNCGQVVDCTPLCNGECCGDGLCASGHGSVCCGDRRCSGECCANGACAAEQEGQHCCGGAPCKGQCRDDQCFTGDAGCLSPDVACQAPRVCLGNGTCVVPCDSPSACLAAGCPDTSICLTTSGATGWCTTGGFAGTCSNDTDCAFGAICLNNVCITTC